YEQLKSLLLRHGNGEHDVADALKKLETKPDSEARKAVLIEELESSGASKDLAIQDQARLLLDLVKELPAGNTSSQIAIGTGIAQADRGSSATVNITRHQEVFKIAAIEPSIDRAQERLHSLSGFWLQRVNDRQWR